MMTNEPAAPQPQSFEESFGSDLINVGVAQGVPCFFLCFSRIALASRGAVALPRRIPRARNWPRSKLGLGSSYYCRPVMHRRHHPSHGEKPPFSPRPSFAAPAARNQLPKLIYEWSRRWGIAHDCTCSCVAAPDPRGLSNFCGHVFSCARSFFHGTDDATLTWAARPCLNLLDFGPTAYTGSRSGVFGSYINTRRTKKFCTVILLLSV
ncbi:hypothetical protein EDB84DRAFT_357490 [Lactarius hengduanensis]|nr:hypothetical protein EDB84DRAFT_357490 [Lactarius hengduanensis]